MKRLIPALVMTTASLGLSAQSTGVISGTVKNAKGAPITGATVLLKRVGMEWTKSVTTGDDGKFMQVGLDPREYDIEVSATGLYLSSFEKEFGFLNLLLKILCF